MDSTLSALLERYQGMNAVERRAFCVGIQLVNSSVSEQLENELRWLQFAGMGLDDIVAMIAKQKGQSAEVTGQEIRQKLFKEMVNTAAIAVSHDAAGAKMPVAEPIAKLEPAKCDAHVPARFDPVPQPALVPQPEPEVEVMRPPQMKIDVLDSDAQEEAQPEPSNIPQPQIDAVSLLVEELEPEPVVAPKPIQPGRGLRPRLGPSL